MEDESLQLQDYAPSDPLLLEPGIPWWVWGLIVLAALLLVAVLLHFAKRRKGPAPPPLPDPDEAYRIASDELSKAGLLGDREAATAGSAAIRRYLATTCRDPSLYETHEEFVSRHEALQGFSPDVREVTSRLFERLAELKYDKDRSGDTREVTEACRHVLDKLHRNQPS